MANAKYQLPHDIKINREIAEDLKISLNSILEHEKRYGELYLSDVDRQAIQAFLELIRDKEARTINYLSSKQ